MLEFFKHIEDRIVGLVPAYPNLSFDTLYDRQKISMEETTIEKHRFTLQFTQQVTCRPGEAVYLKKQFAQSLHRHMYQEVADSLHILEPHIYNRDEEKTKQQLYKLFDLLRY